MTIPRHLDTSALLIFDLLIFVGSGLIQVNKNVLKCSKITLNQNLFHCYFAKFEYLIGENFAGGN